jgi:predicted nucleotidyltransferase
MIEKSTIQKVLEVFFDHPTRQFHLRELSRLLELSMPTIVSTTEQLAKQKLILKERGTVVTSVKANLENKAFILKKRVYNLEKLYDSGIVEHLIEEYNHPKAIILFGSFSRGEDIEKSDVDIAVVTHKHLKPNVKVYEKILKRSINIHEIELHEISDEFKTNLSNGIVLEGSW